MVRRTVPVFLIAALAAPLASSAAPATGPSDAQIAAIVVAANQVDIDAGRYAEGHAAADDVKEFAKRMVVDHGGVNRSAVQLVTKLKVVPEDNATARDLRAGGDANLARLKSLSGPGFDLAYVEHEVAYHVQVLEALDGVLIPSARNAELKSLLVSVRPAFVAHLEHARHLRAALAKE